MKLRTLALALTVLIPTSPARADEASEKAAAELLKKRMATQRPDDLIILEAVKGKDVIVVQGSMDHIEQILASANIRHTVVQPEQVGDLDLNADQIVMVNCPGHMPQRGIERIQKFVRAGGLLYTTDWALLNLVQVAFPGTIAHNGRSTGSEVTSVQVHRHDDNLMTNMLLREKGEPQWWLEGGSYPIKIVDPKKVEVLAESAEMGSKYGAAPIVVRFRWDDGEVIHVVSHFYRQVQTRGTAVAAKNAIDNVKGLTAEQKKDFKASAASGANMGDVESSYAFQQMTSNLIVEKSKRNETIDKAYDVKPTANVNIGGRDVQKGERLKTIAKKGSKIRVRDDRGNEADVDAALLEAR